MGDEIKIPVKHLAIVLVVVVLAGLIILVGKTTGFAIGGGEVSEAEAQKNLMNFFEKQVLDSTVEVVSVSKTFFTALIILRSAV